MTDQSENTAEQPQNTAEQQTQNTANKEESESDKKIPRGSRPLVIDLREAVSIIQDFSDKAGGVGAGEDLALIMESTTLSSFFRSRIAVLRKFGLVEGENTRVEITKLGWQIVAPKERSEKAAALKAAFLNIDVFKQIYQKFAGRILPQDEFLVNSFADFVPRDIAKEWMRQFKDSAKFAGLLIDRGENRFQIREGIGINGDTEFEEKTDDEKPSEDEKPAEKPAQAVQPQVAVRQDKTSFQFLIDILNPADMSAEEQQAVWTLIQYLKKKETGVI